MKDVNHHKWSEWCFKEGVTLKCWVGGKTTTSMGNGTKHYTEISI